MATTETYSRSSLRGNAESQSSGGPDALHELLTVEEVADLLKVNSSWVYEHTRSRSVRQAERLPHIKIGKYLRFDAGAIRAFIEKKKCQPR